MCSISVTQHKLNKMNTQILTLATILGIGSMAYGQTARVQVIHNSADAAAASVDIWLNDGPLFTNVDFRTASPFVDAPSGVDFDISIQPAGSTDTIGAPYRATLNLTDGATYVVVANGILSSSGYSPAPAFGLDVFPMGREMAAGGMMMTDVLVCHGSTDAPTVNVVETGAGAGEVVSGASYGDFAGYLELPTADYSLQVRTVNNTTVAQYGAPLAGLGLGGAALTVVASGFLDPSMNSNGAGFGLYAALAAGGALVPLPIEALNTARVQIIHNSADAAAASVDIWLNDGPLFTNVDFRTASPFVDAPAGVDFDISIQPAGSTDTIGAPFRTTYNLAGGEKYMIVANGILSTSGYSPAPAFGLDVYATAREAAAGGMGMTDVLVMHGSTDAPTVDVFESGVGAGTIVDDISYGDFQGYLELGTLDYTLQIRNENNSAIVAAFEAPLAGLGQDGAALAVLASGFLDPSMNSIGAPFGLFAVLPAGGAFVPLPAAAIPMARAQVIHNSADAAAASVDVWLNDGPLVTDFDFRTATPFVDVQAGVPFDVTIQGAGSTDTTNAVARFTYTLDEGETYVLIANGIVSGSGYSPNIPFDINVFAGAQEMSMDAMNVDILAFHGSTDAGTVDVVETTVPVDPLIADFMYEDFEGYVPLAENDYVLSIESGGQSIVTYQVPLQSLGWAGEAVTLVASGFLDPSMNSNGAPFGLWVARATGGDLVELPISTGIVENDKILDLLVFPNPTTDNVQVRMNLVESGQTAMQVIDPLGRIVQERNMGQLSAGQQNFLVDLQDVTTGLYTMRLIQGNNIVTVPVQKF